jgi:hypothetical protein
MSNIRITTFISIILVISFALLNLAFTSKQNSFSISTTGKIRYARWPISSICMFPYDDYYSQKGTDTKLDEIRARLPEVNYIEIRTYWQSDPNNPDNMTYTGGDIGYLGTPVNSWEELEAATSKIRSRNMDVILWATIFWGSPRPNPSNWTIWLQNYAKYAKMVAEWAQDHQIPIFVFGAEYDNWIPEYSLIGSKYADQWNNIISEIRSVYSGKVVYGFNWWYDPLNWETIYNQTSWIANLDYIQIDTFVSLGVNLYDYINGTRVNATEIAKWWNPSIQDLIGNWTDSRFGPHWNYVQMFEQLSNKYGKKIIIDIGYRNNNGTNTMPWMNVPLHDMYENEIPGWGPDVKEMNDSWKAFFLTWANSSAIIGVDMEHYTQGNTNDMDGSFRNKYDPTTGNYTWQVIHSYLITLNSP